MFIAHLSAGYLLTQAALKQTGHASRWLLWAGLTASLFPDLDLLYFYLIDHRQTEHHYYVTHLPLFWIALGMIAYSLLKPRYHIWIRIILANLLLHMALDSIVSYIFWLSPLSGIRLQLAHIPDRGGWWVWNFVLHWTFLLEILIITASLFVWRRACRKAS